MLDASVRLANTARLRWSGSHPPPRPDLANRIDELWTTLRADNPALDNGTICTLESASPTEIVVASTSYRDYAAQRSDPSLAADLGIVAVGVSGVVRIATRVIVGRRAAVSDYRGVWELVPSGHLPAEGGPTDPRKQLAIELTEETGIASRHIVETRLLALVPDPATNTVDICARLDLDMSPSELASVLASAPRAEYDEFLVLGHAELTRLQSKPDVKFVPTSSVLLHDFATEIWFDR